MAIKRTNLGGSGVSAEQQAAIAAASPKPGTLTATGYIQGQVSVTTSVTLTNNRLRLGPVVFPHAVTITAVGTEFTVAGDATSLVRIGIYSDTGSGYPAALLNGEVAISTGSGNAGTVTTGGTPGVYAAALASPLVLQTGTYWIGAAVQGATTTQPTVRSAGFMQFAAATTALPSAGAVGSGYFQDSVSGALPATFQAFPGGGISSPLPRILLRLG